MTFLLSSCLQKSLHVVLLASSLLGVSKIGKSQVQIPDVIRQQVMGIQDRFNTVLDEECPAGTCFSVGCQSSRFETLDESQTSSLPGLETDGPVGKVQYKLMSVLCEFTHEDTLGVTEIAALRQRLGQKVKSVGLTVQIQARALPPKFSERKAEEPELMMAALTPQEKVVMTFLPFLPWILVGLVIIIGALILIWAFRRLGKPVKRDPGQRTRTSDSGSTALEVAEPEPTANMLMARLGQVRSELESDAALVEQTLKKHLIDENTEELCLFLKYFGPDLLKGLKEKAEYHKILAALSEAYDSKEVVDSAAITWKFLDRLERSMIAAKVRLDSQPLEDEFKFLMSAEIDEFIGILRDLSEPEAIAAVAYAPRRLRERFFASANPTFTAKFVEQVTKIDKMPDPFVRDVARKLRKIYAEKGQDLRTIRVDKIPLLEQALNSLEGKDRIRLLVDIGKDNPNFLQSVAPNVFLDDALPLLTDDVLTEALLNISPQEAGAYLGGFEWGGGVLKRISPRLQDTIKPYMSTNNAANPITVGSARKKIAEFVKEQDHLGKIDLRSLNVQLIVGQGK